MFNVRVIQWSDNGQSNARCLAGCQEVCILLLDVGVVGKFNSFLMCPIASQAHWWYAGIWVMQTYTIFVHVISYVISHTEDYISTLRFVKDFTNFLISAIHQHHACLEYISLVNLTIQNTTKNREVREDSCRITQNKCVNWYTATHYTSFIRDVLLGIPINQPPCFLQGAQVRSLVRE